MKAKIEITLEPFATPNFVQTEELDESIPLSRIDAETLEALCQEFTKEVFKKAGKEDRCDREGVDGEMTIRVLNKYQGVQGIYIGRPSPLGNPFVIGRDGTREEVINNYTIWLRSQMEEGGRVREEIERLARIYRETGELNLVCWCAPRVCHGDVIKQEVLKRQAMAEDKQ